MYAVWIALQWTLLHPDPSSTSITANELTFNLLHNSLKKLFKRAIYDAYHFYYDTYNHIFKKYKKAVQHIELCIQNTINTYDALQQTKFKKDGAIANGRFRATVDKIMVDQNDNDHAKLPNKCEIEGLDKEIIELTKKYQEYRDEAVKGEHKVKYDNLGDEGRMGVWVAHKFYLQNRHSKAPTTRRNHPKHIIVCSTLPNLFLFSNHQLVNVI